MQHIQLNTFSRSNIIHQPYCGVFYLNVFAVGLLTGAGNVEVSGVLNEPCSGYWSHLLLFLGAENPLPQKQGV